MAKPAELRVAPRKGASPVEVKSLIQHLRLKYQVSQVAMQEAMGCSYYKLKKLLDSSRYPSVSELRALKKIFPSEDLSAKTVRSFDPYVIQTSAALRDPRRVGMSPGQLRNTDSVSRMRAVTPVDEKVLRDHAMTQDSYPTYATPATRTSIPIRYEHLARLEEMAEMLGESKATSLRRVLNYAFEQLQNMSTEDLGTSSGMGGSQWPVDRDPELQEVILESRKRTRVPAPVFSSPVQTIEDPPELDQSLPEAPSDDEEGLEESEGSESASESGEGDTQLFTMASSRTWKPTLLTPAASEDKDT